MPDERTLADHRAANAHRRPRRGALRVVVAAAVLAVIVAAGAGRLGATGAALAADPCAPPVTNPVACENTKPGTPRSTWDVTGAGSTSIQGFATDISVNRGETVRFKVNTGARSYRLDIYRMGYYGGNGARLITTVTPSATLPQRQPACLTQASTGLVDCGNWAVSASWAVPPDAVSGIYFATLVRTDGTAGSSHVAFVVRDDASHSDLLFETSDTTWQAYNQYGGNSLYTGGPVGRAYKVSYNRPFTTRGTGAEDWVFNAEYPMVRWLEANGYDVSYFTGLDGARNGALIKSHKAFLSVGHDEYWSGSQRANVEAARDAGVSLAFFSGNEVFWKTRWEPSIDSSATANRTLVAYKETHANQPIDPQDPPTWTGTWRDTRFSPPADGGRPENGLTGTIFMVNGGPARRDSIKVPAAFRTLRFWRGTSVASLATGATKTMPAGTLGYEWDEERDNGARPAGLIRMSSATYDVGADYLQDFGSTFGAGTATHNLTLYRAASGALVFGAGTVQWSWGLDADHDFAGTAVDRDMKQATVNLLADMKVQPSTLQTGLVAATASTDTTAPSATITAPGDGDTVASGATITVSGTAADTGGVVAGVEVSTDGGVRWHPATGTTSWTYSWTPRGTTAKLLARATDDSANAGVASAPVSVTVGGTRTCPCTIWSDASTPASPNEPDATANELGLKFRSDTAGSITGLRFYKSSQNTGTHVGRLWSRTGQLLASATFTNETASGWQRVTFPTPVAITADTTYVASYTAPNGHYAEDENAFSSAGVDSDPLHALATGVDGVNGVYGLAGSFPTSVFLNSNYWVDVVFAASGPDTTAPTLTGRSPASGATGVGIAAKVTATFNEAVQQPTISFTLRDAVTGTTVAAATSYDAATRTATLTPNAPLSPSTAYTATVSGAQDAAGNTMASDGWGFTTAAADTTAPTISARAPAGGATGVATSATVTATFSEPVQATTIDLALRNTATNATVAAATTYDATTRMATLTPGAALSPATTYSATVSGAQDDAGNTMAPDSWSFTTAAAPATACPCSIWPPSATPGVASDADSASVELGVRFRSDLNGSITGIRFYKATANTGTHTGSLWSSTGTRLTTGTFASETASGWQQLTFATPVAIQAGTTYVASYHAPNGRYAADAGFFGASGVDNPPLHALADGLGGANGVYAYGTTTAFPTSTFQASNYWVDVVFRP